MRNDFEDRLDSAENASLPLLQGKHIARSLGWERNQLCETVCPDVAGMMDDPQEPESEDAISAACELSRRVFFWTYRPPCEDLDGFLCRSIIACWIFVPQLRSYTMTEMAKRFGKKKQSLGRWADDFKLAFPEIKHIAHLKP